MQNDLNSFNPSSMILGSDVTVRDTWRATLLQLLHKLYEYYEYYILSIWLHCESATLCLYVNDHIVMQIRELIVIFVIRILIKDKTLDYNFYI